MLLLNIIRQLLKLILFHILADNFVISLSEEPVLLLQMAERCSWSCRADLVALLYLLHDRLGKISITHFDPGNFPRGMMGPFDAFVIHKVLFVSWLG